MDHDELVNKRVRRIAKDTAAVDDVHAALVGIRSSLGLEAQRAANAQFAGRKGYTIAAEFTEVETGKGANMLERRPMNDGAHHRAAA